MYTDKLDYALEAPTPIVTVVAYGYNTTWNSAISHLRWQQTGSNAIIRNRDHLVILYVPVGRTFHLIKCVSLTFGAAYMQAMIMRHPYRNHLSCWNAMADAKTSTIMVALEFCAIKLIIVGASLLANWPITL